MKNNNEYNVLILFFNNFERFKLVFSEVKKAKPQNLFLFQDGPREGRNDLDGIITIRKYIEEQIDWDCNVYKNYQEKNLGCDPSEYISQKWAFSFVDKCIILEDDDVPSESFFPFCWELLKKYESNESINMICGMNHLEIYHPKNSPSSDYFFSKTCSIWGWATWKRVIDTWDEKYSWMDKEEDVKLLRKNMRRREFVKLLKMCKRHRETGIPFYESILSASFNMYNRVSIVPTVNMISNIGFSSGTHSFADQLSELPKKTRKLYLIPLHTVSLPLRDPADNKPSKAYKNKVEKMLHLTLVEKLFYKFKKALKKN